MSAALEAAAKRRAAVIAEAARGIRERSLAAAAKTRADAVAAQFDALSPEDKAHFAMMVTYRVGLRPTNIPR